MTAGDLSRHFEVSRPTMSAHFAVLKEADLIHAERSGKSITYYLKLSVLEEALMGFAHTFGLGPTAGGAAAPTLPVSSKKATSR